MRRTGVFRERNVEIMTANNTIQLQPVHIDALTEVGNIGSGNAATALAALMGASVDIQIPVITLVDYQEIAQLLGGGDASVICIFLELSGDLSGMLLHVVKPNFASKLINTFYPSSISSLKDISEMDLSVVSEMGNITSAAYVKALADLTGLFINISPPSAETGTIDSVLRASEDRIPRLGDQVLFVDETLTVGDSEMDANMILLPDADSLRVLFEHLHVSF